MLVNTDIITEYSFPTVLKPVQVPPGCYPIEIVQFWRGEYGRDRPLPLHWAIFIRTSAKYGNRHEVVGNINTYSTQARFDVPLPLLEDKDNEWRGSHVIGYVSPAQMDKLWNHVALVPVVHKMLSWNCQNWVYDALKGLGAPGLYIDENMTWPVLQTHMRCLLDAWEAGDI